MGKGWGEAGGGGEGEGNLRCNLRSGGPSSLFLWPLCLFSHLRSPPKKKKKQKQKKPTPDPRLLEVGLSSHSIRNNLFSHLKNLIKLPRLPGTINCKQCAKFMA